MKTSSVVFSLLLVFSLQGFAQLSPDWLEKIHPLNDASLVATPDDGHVALLQAFDSAKKSIDMEIYHLTDLQMVQSLVAARSRGVEVQVIYDFRSLQSPHYQEYFTKLKDGGVSVVKSTANFSICHAKTFLIDKKLLFVSTMNFIGHFSTMRDYGLFTTDQAMITEWQSVFATDLQNAKVNGNTTPSLSNPNLVISPVNSEQKIIDLINSAKRSIRGVVENFGNNNVITALVNARARGVQVQMITPECDLNPNPLHNYPYLYTLAKAGAENRLMPVPASSETPYMHAKVLVVDSQVAFLGSENFSYNSLMQAREIGVVFSNAQMIKGLEQLMAKDWANSQPLPPTEPAHCKSLSPSALFGEEF